MIGIIVIGPESSGTRMTTKICCLAGANGSDNHVQKWDGYGNPDIDIGKIPHADKTKIPLVWRRSIPHGPKYSDLGLMTKTMRDNGYDDVRVIVTSRDWVPQVKSMYKNHIEANGRTDNPILRTQKAYCHIFSEIAKHNLPFILTNYECICTDINSTNSFLVFVGLRELNTSEYENLNLKIANEKWYV